MKSLTDAQARAYIMGEEPFDKAQWCKQHAQHLADAVQRAFAENDPRFDRNLLKTGEHYLRSEYMRFNEKAQSELKKMLEAIKERISKNEKLYF